jgi:hypothetical protein
MDDNKIRIFGAWRANVTGLGAREPHVEGLALPISVESGNLSFSKTGIRWISVKCFIMSDEWWEGNLAGIGLR